MQYTLNNKRQAVLEKIIESFESGAVSKEEFIKVMTTFKGLLNDMKVSFDSGMDNMSSDVISTVKDIKEMIDVFEKRMNKMSLNLESSHSEEMKEMEKMMKDCMKEMARIEAMIPDVTDLTPLERKIENAIEEVEKKIPSLPEELKAEAIRDKLENLKGDERLDKSAIKGLEDDINELRKEMAASRTLVGGSRRVFQPYLDDFSSQTNGSTKIFYLSREPLKTNTILVWGTDFPIILRPTTDFTVTGKTLTLTAAVPAPSEGATLLIQYYA